MHFKWGKSTQSDPWRIASCCYADGYVYKYHGSHQQIKSHRAEKPLPIKWYIDLHETAGAWGNETLKPPPALPESLKPKRSRIHTLFPSWFGGEKKPNPLYSLSSFCLVFSTRLFLMYGSLRQQSIISLLLQFVPNLSFVYMPQRKPQVRTAWAQSVQDTPAGFCAFSSTGTKGWQTNFSNFCSFSPFSATFGF